MCFYTGYTRQLDSGHVSNLRRPWCQTLSPCDQRRWWFGQTDTVTKWPWFPPRTGRGSMSSNDDSISSRPSMSRGGPSTGALGYQNLEHWLLSGTEIQDFYSQMDNSASITGLTDTVHRNSPESSNTALCFRAPSVLHDLPISEFDRVLTLFNSCLCTASGAMCEPRPHGGAWLEGRSGDVLREKYRESCSAF